MSPRQSLASTDSPHSGERAIAESYSRRSRAIRPGRAYFRFPDGEKNFMAYKELRLWARGVRNGWGANGDLEFFVEDRPRSEQLLYVSNDTQRWQWKGRMVA